MEVGDISQWVTLVGAVIAAGASSLNLWWQFAQKGDKIKVGFGPLRPKIEPGYWLYVVSLRDHQMILADYGFISESGGLLSLPQLCSDEPFDTALICGGTTFFDKRGGLFEVSVGDLRDNQIGAFAITARQKRYTLGFRRDVPWCKQFWIKLKIGWKPGYPSDMSI